MPLFSHRHNSSALPTSTTTNSSYSAKDQKLHKLNSKISLPILLFSLLSIFFGLAGTIFAVNAIRSPSPLPVYRCGRSEDTFRAFYSLSDSRKLHDNGALLDRPKLLGFVGIQTGFGSADRRVALRSTWFPSDPDGLLSLRMFSNEDVIIGSWMLAMNVHHEDNRAICDPRCTSTSIAV
ncbi:hypothetical protein AB3S75_016622 [Citrus x aurantiifolia]